MLDSRLEYSRRPGKIAIFVPSGLKAIACRQDLLFTLSKTWIIGGNFAENSLAATILEASGIIDGKILWVKSRELQ